MAPARMEGRTGTTSFESTDLIEKIKETYACDYFLQIGASEQLNCTLTALMICSGLRSCLNAFTLRLGSSV